MFCRLNVRKSVSLRRLNVRKNVKIGMERLLYNDLCKWKGSTVRKPLILNGARQVGKTWLLREFGRREYGSVAYVNCQRSEDMESVFRDFDTGRMVRALSAYSGVTIRPGTTLVILDEIQDFPRALTALKYFREDAPDYHIAVAGSLLGLSLHGGVSYPVGQVETLNLYPMTFAEFVLAAGNRPLYDALRDADYAVINAAAGLLTDLLRQYYYTGGMPEAVGTYMESGDLVRVRAAQKQILQDYERDFSKHADSREVPRIRMVWNAVPQQLAKENRRFVYKELKRGGRAAEFETAIEWLQDAGLVYKVPRITEPKQPLRFYEEPSAFKLFALDTGLLGAMMDTAARDVVIDNRAFSEYKGAFTENFVLTQLIPSGVPVRYYATNDSRVEIDFVVQTADGVVPVEVKAEENVRSRSLRTFLDKYPDLHAVRLSMKPYIEQERVTNIPLFAVNTFP